MEIGRDGVLTATPSPILDYGLTPLGFTAVRHCRNGVPFQSGAAFRGAAFSIGITAAGLRIRQWSPYRCWQMCCWH